MKSTNFLLFIGVSILTISLMNCKSGKLQADNPLFANKWVLSELNGVPVQTSGTDKDANINFSFPDRKVSGSGGCNRFNGSFTATGKDLSFGTLATTKMMCPDIKFEDVFFATLAKVKNYEIAGKDLFLKDGNTVLAKLTTR